MSPDFRPGADAYLTRRIAVGCARRSLLGAAPMAGYTGGFTFYVQDGLLHYVHNYVGQALYEVVSDRPLPTGPVTTRFEFEVATPPDVRAGRGAGGLGQLYFDGELVANTEIPVTTPILFGLEGLSCGYDAGAAVVPTYTSPFTFTGTIHKVTVDISGDLFVDDDHQAAHYEAQGPRCWRESEPTGAILASTSERGSGSGQAHAHYDTRSNVADQTCASARSWRSMPRRRRPRPHPVRTEAPDRCAG